MADTTNLGISKPTPGASENVWGTTLNTGADNFDTAVAGTLSKSVAGSADVSLTDAEALNANHIYTGELTGNIAVHVPIKSRRYQVFNNTTGSFSLKVKTSSETNGTEVTQGASMVLFCDGTSVMDGISGVGQTSVTDFTANNLKVPTCVSATNLVAATGSFTTKVSGVAGEFSGTVSAATFDGALTGNVTGDIDGATGSFSACVSATNFVAATGSFTTKVSGVAGEFSGTVSATTFDGALIGDVTGDITGNLTGDVDGATGSFSACISSTNLVAATGSFTTKVSGVAGELSGAVSVGGGLWTEGGAVFNEAGADVDFRVESDGNTNMLLVDAGINAVGVGTPPSDTEILNVGTGSGVQGTQYDIIKYQGYGSGPITGIKNTSVGTAATTICNIAIGGVCGGLVFVTGGTDPNTFSDTVQFHAQGNTPTVIASNTKNSPPARTYSVSGNSLQLAYASGTHNAAVWYIVMRSN